jgi:hypothetical protein
MDLHPPASVSAAVEQLDHLIDRELDEPFARALQEASYRNPNPGPCWRELADRLRRAAALADWLAANDHH